MTSEQYLLDVLLFDLGLKVSGHSKSSFRAAIIIHLLFIHKLLAKAFEYIFLQERNI
ncbi:hypothetical protein D3C71_1862320 [compost metagenome]